MYSQIHAAITIVHFGTFSSPHKFLTLGAPGSLSCLSIRLFFFFFFKTFIYYWGRERHTQSMSRGGQREGKTEFEAGSRLWAVSTEPNAGLELTNCEIMTWAEVGRSTNWAIQVPQHPTLDFGSGHDLLVCEREHHIRLCANSMESAWDSLFLSLPLSCSCAHAH